MLSFLMILGIKKAKSVFEFGFLKNEEVITEPK